MIEVTLRFPLSFQMFYWDLFHHLWKLKNKVHILQHSFDQWTSVTLSFFEYRERMRMRRRVPFSTIVLKHKVKQRGFPRKKNDTFNCLRKANQNSFLEEGRIKACIARVHILWLGVYFQRVSRIKWLPKPGSRESFSRFNLYHIFRLRVVANACLKPWIVCKAFFWLSGRKHKSILWHWM